MTTTPTWRDLAFPGDGEMATRCRTHEWATTPLGDAEAWPAELRAAAAIVVASPIPMVLLWGDRLVQLYNDAYRAPLRDRHPAALGQPIDETWPDLRHVNAPVHERVRAGEGVVVEGAPFRVVRDMAVEDAWFTVAYSPVRDANGTVAGMLVTMVDTTGQLVAQRRADAANRAKGDFLTVMSHELRTPLNAIGGYAELLELGVRGPITADQRTDLTRIQQSQRHLLDVINGVLSYAKAEGGLLHYAVEDVVMDELLARCAALVATEAREKGISLCHGGCVTRLAARADADKVQQIVLNLLTNAIKFTKPGGSVTLACTAEEDKRLIVAVTDTGSGIAPSNLECVFQPFVQADARMTRAQEGTGLGLAISREMARGMGGELTVTSTLGEGSTFVLTLACGRRDAQADSPAKREGDSH